MWESTLRVLIVEDSPADVRLVVQELRQAGFDLEVTQVDTEADFLAHLDPAPDIILCDYNLPQFDALRANNPGETGQRVKPVADLGTRGCNCLHRRTIPAFS